MNGEADDRDELAADALAALARFTTGDRSTATLDALESTSKAFAAGKVAAPTPYQVRLEMRNCYLRRAGYAIEARSLWARAGELAKRVRTFELRHWESWQHFSQAPKRADAVDALLWQARVLNGADELPQSQGGLFRLF